MHVDLPEKIDLVVIDCAWTKQKHILPRAKKLLKTGGQIVTLIKPHYEADPQLLRKGILPQDQLESIVATVIASIKTDGFTVVNRVESPIKGSQGNTEVLALLTIT